VSQQINLFSPIFLTQKKYFSAHTMAQGLGLIVLGSLAFFAYAFWQTAGMTKQATETARHVTMEQARLERVRANYAPRGKSQLLQQEIGRLETQMGARAQVLELLKGGEFGRTAGFSEYLRAFARQTVDGLWLTGFSIKGNEMTISGRALQPELVPTYLQRLQREPTMQGKSFANLEMATPKTEPANKGAPVTPPRYVEFTLQSNEPGAAK
jgi:Tfp pilus assembly protein PilN